MKTFVAILLLIFTTLIVSACQPEQPACQPGTIQHLDDGTKFPAISTADSAAPPVTKKIKGKTVQIDRVVEGPLCNEHLSGTVYVSCNLQIKPWKDQPDFLRGCDFTVAPDTVIYVAWHHDTAYYNGCSACHAGQ